jgi:hypothetical protein
MIKLFEFLPLKTDERLALPPDPPPSTQFRRVTIESICFLEQIGENGLARLEAKKLVEHLKDAFSL